MEKPTEGIGVVRSVARLLVPDRIRHPVAVLVYGEQGQEQWLRTVMNRDIARYVASLPCAELDAVEVSGNRLAQIGWRSYRSVNFPEFDLCAPLAETQVADVVICEQVLEHVLDPITATRNLFGLLRPGGRLIVNTPFLVKIHAHPGDFWRFTPDGLRILLAQAGFSDIEVEAWGNRFVAFQNFGKRWRPIRRFGQPMFNEPNLPVSVWAYGHRPLSVNSDA
jgi:SAM-dependent methyltransferase